MTSVARALASAASEFASFATESASVVSDIPLFLSEIAGRRSEIVNEFAYFASPPGIRCSLATEKVTMTTTFL